MSYYPEFSHRIEEALARLDRSPSWLAQRLDVNPSTVSRWLNQGARPRDPETVVRVADVLGMTAQRQALLAAAGFGYQDAQSVPGPVSAADISPYNNLPAGQTPFIGRQRQLAHIAHRLADPDCRLLTVVGPGGIGKTRLAIRAAQEQASHFADGVCFVDLTSVAAPSLMSSTMLRALNAPESGARNSAQRLCDFLSDRELLLVLDSFEHLMDRVELLPRLLRSAPGLTLLVTSRERLNLVEEWLEPVGGLALPPKSELDAADTDGVSLNAFDATRLFLASMRRIRPAYEASREDAHSIGAVCRLLEGMPLAIELAAAWTRSLPPSAVLRETQRSLDFLSTSMRDMPDRHRSIHAVFGHSWSMLTERERSILRQFSVFRGGATQEALEAVIGATLSEAAELVDKSWLRPDPTGRYTIHELVRQYCEEKLEAEQVSENGNEDGSVSDRHRNYYHTYLSEKLRDANYVPAVADEMELELGNLMAALQSAVHRHEMQTALSLCWCLWFVGDLTGRQRYTIQLMDTVVPMIEKQLTGATTSEPLRTEVAHALCGILYAQRDQYLQLGMLDESAHCAHRISTLADEMQPGRRRIYWTALGRSGDAGAAREAGDYRAARNIWLEALELVSADEFECFIYEGERRKFWQIQIYHNLAGISWALGDYSEAEKFLKRSIGLCDANGVKRSKGQFLAIHSRIARTRGEYTRAAEETQAGLDLCEVCRDQVGIAIGHLGLGCVQSACGCYDSARRHLVACLETGRESGRIDILVQPLIELGNLELAIGDKRKARRRFDEALSVVQHTGASHNNVLPQIWIGLALVALDEADVAEARKLFVRALNTKGRTAVDTMRSIEGLAEVSAQERDLPQAVRFFSLVARHPFTDHATRTQAQAKIGKLERDCEKEEFAAWLAEAGQLQLDDVVQALIGETPKRL